MKSKQVLSIEQMKHLQELGLDTSDASMCWCCFLGNIEEEWELEIYENVLNQKRDSTFWETLTPCRTFWISCQNQYRYMICTYLRKWGCGGSNM